MTFVNKLVLHHIHHQLLENTELTVERAYTTTMSLQMPQKNFDTYFSETRLPAIVFPEDKHSLAKVKDLSKVSHGIKNDETTAIMLMNFPETC